MNRKALTYSPTFMDSVAQYRSIFIVSNLIQLQINITTLKDYAPLPVPPLKSPLISPLFSINSPDY